MAVSRSAGILLFRRSAGIEVWLGHMGGPLWARKDAAAWSIPKGLYEQPEHPLSAAIREFTEEIGTPPPAVGFEELGEFRQSSGKIVTVFTAESDFEVDEVHSNTFRLEWPPRSGAFADYPEIDRAAWFTVDEARVKIVKGQLPALDALIARLGGAHDTEATMIRDFEPEAAAVLPEHVYDYFRATAGGPEVLADQVAAWESIRHLPRVLRDTTSVDTSTTVLGTAVDTPIMIAPMAQQIAASPEGEVATARAAAAAGTVIGISTNTAVPFADIRSTGARWWFQLYIMRDRSLTEALLQRALDAEAKAVILTVDITGLGHPRAGSSTSVEPDEWGDLPEGRRLVNLTAAERLRSRGEGGSIARDLGFDTVSWLRDQTGLPVIVKGILRADDARRAVDAGAAAVIVSTHGGRGLASATPAALVLADIAAAVGDQAEVYADSGIRSGAAVASAIAMGARAVFIGRPAMWGLATGASDGVRRVIDGFTDDLSRVMNLLGTPALPDLTSDLIDPRDPRPRDRGPRAGMAPAVGRPR